MTLNPDPTPGPGVGLTRGAAPGGPREKLELAHHLLEEVQKLLREFGELLDGEEEQPQGRRGAKAKKPRRK